MIELSDTKRKAPPERFISADNERNQNAMPVFYLNSFKNDALNLVHWVNYVKPRKSNIN